MSKKLSTVLAICVFLLSKQICSAAEIDQAPIEIKDCDFIGEEYPDIEYGFFHQYDFHKYISTLFYEDRPKRGEFETTPEYHERMIGRVIESLERTAPKVLCFLSEPTTGSYDPDKEILNISGIYFSEHYNKKFFEFKPKEFAVNHGAYSVVTDSDFYYTKPISYKKITSRCARSCLQATFRYGVALQAKNAKKFHEFSFPIPLDVAKVELQKHDRKRYQVLYKFKWDYGNFIKVVHKLPAGMGGNNKWLYDQKRSKDYYLTGTLLSVTLLNITDGAIVKHVPLR